MPAVVSIRTPSGTGSGFFLTADTIVTNEHVVAGHSSVTVRTHDGVERPGRVVTRQASVDLATVKLMQAVPQRALIAGRSTDVRVGQEVLAIGSPLGIENTVTRGIVSGIRRVGTVTLLQTDAAVNPGNSGGPLLNRQGQVVGITTLKLSRAEQMSFAVAIDHALPLLEGRTQSSSQPSLRSILPGGTPEASETDLMRENAERAFGQALQRAQAAVSNFKEDFNRYNSACNPTIALGACLQSARPVDRHRNGEGNHRALPCPVDRSHRPGRCDETVLPADRRTRAAGRHPSRCDARPFRPLRGGRRRGCGGAVGAWQRSQAFASYRRPSMCPVRLPPPLCATRARMSSRWNLRLAIRLRAAAPAVVRRALCTGSMFDVSTSSPRTGPRASPRAARGGRRSHHLAASGVPRTSRAVLEGAARSLSAALPGGDHRLSPPAARRSRSRPHVSGRGGAGCATRTASNADRRPFRVRSKPSIVTLDLLLARERMGEAGFGEVALSQAAVAFAAPRRHGLTTGNGWLGGGAAAYNLYARAMAG